MESMDIAARNPILFAGDSVAGTDVDMASTAHAIGGDMREDRREDCRGGWSCAGGGTAFPAPLTAEVCVCVCVSVCVCVCVCVRKCVCVCARARA